MNIAATMAALDVWDLDRTAKNALVAICCRADRAGTAKVSIPRIAADIAVSYHTARRALARLVEIGYLTVIHKPGTTSVWKLDPDNQMIRVPRAFQNPTPITSDNPPRQSGDRGIQGVFRENQGERVVASLAYPASDDAEGKPTGRAVSHAEFKAALDPATITECQYCDEHGWLWEDDLILGRCSHQRALSDLTLADVLLCGEPSP